MEEGLGNKDVTADSSLSFWLPNLELTPLRSFRQKRCGEGF